MANYNVKKIQDYGTAPVYNESAAVSAAAQQLSSAENKKPGAYTSQYATSINTALNNILNNKGFTYNAAADPLYNQYKDYYTQAGKTAMKDTVGQVSALSGGYGSSYAQTAGQQQYNNYMQQLAQILPQLEDRAYNRYRDSLSDQYSNLSVLQGLDNSAYGKYRDKVSDYYTDRGYAYGKYANERDYDWNKYTAALNQFNNDRTFNYGYDRDTVSDSQWQTTFNENRRQADRDYNESVRQFNANLAEQQRQHNESKIAAAEKSAAQAKANKIKQETEKYFDAAFAEYDKSQSNGEAYIERLIAYGLIDAESAIALRQSASKGHKYADNWQRG